MTKMNRGRIRSVCCSAATLLLVMGCAAAGSEDGGEREPADIAPGALSNAGVMRPGTVTETPSPPAPGGALAGGAAAPSTEVATDPAPVGLEPEVTGTPSVTDPSSSGDPDDPDDAPPASDGSAALIRGADPTSDSATESGPFDVDVSSSGLRDGPDYGTQTLHVPVGAEPPLAGVVVVPGFISPESSIRAWGPFLASHGIVTLTIGTNGGGDSPEVRARALLDGIATLTAENTRAGSPIEGDMALDRFGVMGWSMGGGGTLIAANDHPELRAAVGLAAWSPGVSFGDNRVPTLLLAGSADTLAGGQSQGFFESIPESTPKMLFEVAGGPHDIANDPSSARGEIGRYGLSWLKVFLEGDERYRQFLSETPTQQSDFRDNL